MSTTVTAGLDASVALLGIRHHGPGSARSTLRALDELQPDVVLVELPADCGPAMGWVERGLVPPVALLGWRPDRTERAAFLPLAEFSPEWQAIGWALRHGVELRAIDLPLATVLADDAPTSQPDRPFDPIGELAAAAGDPEPERWWEDVIEHRGDGAPAFEAVAEAMSQLRTTLGAPSDVAEVGLEALREAHMREAIRAARRDGFERVAVLCGAWHVPALDDTAVPATHDRATLRRRPRSKVEVSWVPWTYDRLTAAGYGAGVESPGWYAHVFAHPGPDGVGRFLVDAARYMRAEGFDVSPDHLIGATRLAGALAALRGRPRPGLSEVLDASDSVFADRRSRTLPGGVLLRRRLVIGDALGSVPDAAPQVPLARDLAAEQRRCRLRIEPGERVIELDLRTPNGLRRSHLLHRMVALGLASAHPVDGRGSSGTFRETWSVSAQPEDAVRIVERSPYGTTVVAAATARCVERASSAAALPALQALVDLALRAELPGALAPCLDHLRRRGATAPDLGELIDTLAPLAETLRYGDVRGSDRTAVGEVFSGFVERVLAGVVTALQGVGGDEADVAARRITRIHAALVLDDDPGRRDRWQAVAEQLADATAGGVVAGRAARVLHDAGWWTATTVEARLSRALSPGTDPQDGAAFVEGFLAGSGTVLIHDDELLAIIDAWLCGLAGDAFEQLVPLLRRTFGAFEPAERRRIGWVLADRASDHVPIGASDLDPARVAVAASLVGLLLGLEAGDPDGAAP